MTTQNKFSRGAFLTAGAAALLISASLGVARAEDHAGMDHSKMDHSKMDHGAMDHSAHAAAPAQWVDPGKAQSAAPAEAPKAEAPKADASGADGGGKAGGGSDGEGGAGGRGRQQVGVHLVEATAGDAIQLSGAGGEFGGQGRERLVHRRQRGRWGGQIEILQANLGAEGGGCAREG